MRQPVWNTAAGSLGNFPSATVFTYQLSASPQLPAVTLTYAIISGSLPDGLTMNTAGLISGTPTLVLSDTTSTFVVRATDNYGNIRDRTFSITESGSAVPSFITPGGTIDTILDRINKLINEIEFMKKIRLSLKVFSAFNIRINFHSIPFFRFFNLIQL